jgi:diguanylate cyclase (GGDEF)-like protein
MDFYLQYKEKFDLVLKNEDNVDFFCEIMAKTIRQDIESAGKMLETLLSFTKKHNLNKATAMLKNYYGWYCFDLSRYDEAIKVALEACNILEKYSDEVGKKGLARLCNLLMSVYSQIGQIELSNEWGLRGVEIAEELNDDDMLLSLMLNLAVGYTQLDEYKKAKDILDYVKVKGFDLDPEGQIVYSQALAEIEMYFGNAKKALDEIGKVYKILDILNPYIYISEIKKLEAMAYSKLGDYEKAEKLFKESYDLAVSYNQYFELCNTMVKWSDMLMEKNQIDEAIEKYSQFLELAEKYQFYQVLRYTYQKLYTIYKEKDLLEESLYYLEKYTYTDKKLYNYHNSQWMAKLATSHSEREASFYKILYDKTELLASIGKEIISTLDENEILKIITEKINKFMKTDSFSIAIYNKDNNQITYKYVEDDGKLKEREPYNLDKKDTFASYCIKNKEDILIKNFYNEYKKYLDIGNVDEYPDIKRKNKIYLSYLYTPMVLNDKVIGLMTVQAYDESAYTQNELSTLKILSNYVSIALDNSYTYKNMERIAIYDNLTGLYSRREIFKFGDTGFNIFKKTDQKMTVAMIDIDKFKDVNDTYGHVEGDKVLRSLAELISRNIRRTDYAGRYGGEEFLLVLTNTTGDGAKLITEKIRKLVASKKFVLNKNHKINITVSIGLYEVDKSDKNFISCVKKADEAMYKAKEMSRNRVVLYGDMKDIEDEEA